jgi:lipoprotein-anchoring transpeptidase ErfK/SrfK
MARIVFSGIVLVALTTTATAQSWVPWHQPGAYPERPSRNEGSNSGSTFGLWSLPGGKAPPVLSGGDRPDISPAAPRPVSLATGYGSGTILIDTGARRLYLVQSKSSALMYPISVGRDGFRWTGTEKISRVAAWPNWHPPAEMRERQPELPEKMTGGIRNPLGAKALYLGNSLYRIHGTNNAQSIGQANSSGCFRMTNAHVVDLAARVGVGTAVVVKSRL